MNEIKKALSIGQDLVDLNSNEVPWVKERLENLECENDKFVKKMGGRAKSITQVIEYYSLFEQVVISLSLYSFLSFSVLIELH